MIPKPFLGDPKKWRWSQKLKVIPGYYKHVMHFKLDNRNSDDIWSINLLIYKVIDYNINYVMRNWKMNLLGSPGYIDNEAFRGKKVIFCDFWGMDFYKPLIYTSGHSYLKSGWNLNTFIHVPEQFWRTPQFWASSTVQL